MQTALDLDAMVSTCMLHVWVYVCVHVSSPNNASMIYVHTQEDRADELDTDLEYADDLIRTMESEFDDVRSRLTDAQIRLGTQAHHVGCDDLEQLWEKVRGKRECQACECLKPLRHFSVAQQKKPVGDRTCLSCSCPSPQHTAHQWESQGQPSQAAKAAGAREQFQCRACKVIRTGW